MSKNAALWDKSWGSKPDKVDKAKEKVQKNAAKTPKLIPIYTNRYMFSAETKVPAVFALKGSSIYVVGWSFVHWIQIEFAKVPIPEPDDKTLLSMKKQIPKVPFWGKYIILLDDDEDSE